MIEPTLHALTLVFAGSLAASLLAALRSLRRPNTTRFSKILTALNLAWAFALLSAASLVTFVTLSAYVDTLSLLYLPGGVLFSRPFILFVFGSLYLLPVVVLLLEDADTSRTQRSPKEGTLEREGLWDFLAA